MLRSVKGQATAVVLVSFLASMGLTACPTPQNFMLDLGGQCYQPWFSAPQCTQPKVTRQGSCAGKTGTKECLVERITQVYPGWRIAYPNLNSCAANACTEDIGVTYELRYAVAYAGGPCPNASAPCGSQD
jgi:hypothetical protein